MMNTRNTYLALASVFIASLAAAIALPGAEVIRVLAAVPAIASLFAALLQIARDRIAFERSVALQEANNRFSVGVTSHMAEVAFDKYASFCEEYIAEMFKALTTLIREGPRQNALGHASTLSDIRRKWAVWLTQEVEGKLDLFEQAVREIGANAWLLEMKPGDPEAIKKMYSQFAEVIGLEVWDNKAITGEYTVTAVIGKLRQTLGIDELSVLRSDLVRRAHSGVTR